MQVSGPIVSMVHNFFGLDKAVMTVLENLTSFMFLESILRLNFAQIASGKSFLGSSM